MILEFTHDFRILKLIEATSLEIEQLKIIATASTYHYKSKRTEERCLLHRGEFLPAGFWMRILKLRDIGYTVNIRNYNDFVRAGIEKSDIIDWIDSLPLKYKSRWYQNAGVFAALKYPISKSLLATGSGKSMIIYLICKYLIQNLIEPDKKILIVVPSVGLVKQLPADFAGYFVTEDVIPELPEHKMYLQKNALHEQVIVDDTSICQIYAPHKFMQSRVIVGNMDSLINYPVEFYGQFAAVIVDEAHKCRTETIQQILMRCLQYKMVLYHGLSGTYEDPYSIPGMLTEAYLGPTLLNIAGKQMMDDEMIAKVKITIINMQATTRVSEDYFFAEETQEPDTRWHFEQRWTSDLPERFEVIAKVCGQLDMNQLLLFNTKESVTKMIDYLSENTDKRILRITGEVSGDEREAIRLEMETRDDIIVCATYQTMSTGISINNLHYLHLVESTKSFIRIIQSIGRTVRLHPRKDYAHVFDWCITLRKKPDWPGPKTNILSRHMRSRIAIYKEHKYEHNIKTVEIDRQ